jgi:hypothetical protein
MLALPQSPPRTRSATLPPVTSEVEKKGTTDLCVVVTAGVGEPQMKVRYAAADVDTDLAAPHKHLAQLVSTSVDSGLHTR